MSSWHSGASVWISKRICVDLKDKLSWLKWSGSPRSPGEPVRFECGSPSFAACPMKPDDRCADTNRRQSIPTTRCVILVERCIEVTVASASFTYFRFLNFRNSHYARSGLFDYPNSDGFDHWSYRLPCPRGFPDWRTFGLSSGNRSLRRFCSRGLGHLACLTALSRASAPQFCALLCL